MKKHLPVCQPAFIKLSLFVILFAALWAPQKASAQPDEPPLEPPIFVSPGFPVYEKDILIGFYNPNDGSDTEIYISPSSDGGFSLQCAG